MTPPAAPSPCGGGFAAGSSDPNSPIRCGGASRSAKSARSGRSRLTHACGFEYVLFDESRKRSATSRCDRARRPEVQHGVVGEAAPGCPGGRMGEQMSQRVDGGLTAELAGKDRWLLTEFSAEFRP